MTDAIFSAELAEEELLRLIRQPPPGQFDLHIQRTGDRWMVRTEATNPFRHQFEGTGKTFAEAWTAGGRPFENLQSADD